ncbi:site-specific integrase [Aequorivita viscosa]|uniref:Phage integrase family protein n=1 Tax=Aequorivita viscosa TaxID=797419 RepID=A0A1M6KL74_9FLAO|nr:tyrosine-type recombinase/integrase [Aequorivita viscosa]SDX19144.1 Phage integrase family protein [Aequorivita viscosa]SHJ59679.1 Phage integrase family protein [Aequorivita viscosa]
MASVFFRYRSTKNEGFLTACLLTGLHGKKDFQARSKIKVEKKFWDEYRKNTKFQDDYKKDLKKVIDEKTESLQNFIIAKFDEVTQPETVNNEWLKNTVSLYSNPRKAETIPSDLISYIDFYVSSREAEGEVISETTKTRYKVVQNKITAFQEYRGQSILIKDINNALKVEFISFVKMKEYNFATYQRDMVHILSFAKHARTKNVETHPELDNFKIKIDSKQKKKTQKLKATLSFSELDEIAKIKDLKPPLEDARDWLLISCYCGQRIGDFMRFNKTMLYKDKDINGQEQTFIKFKQEKTGVLMDFPLHPKIVEILDQRNGEFPKRITDQKYNKFIKRICRMAKIKERVKGGKIAKTESGNYRKQTGKFEKWQLIQSHTGRRSFATNFFRIMPIDELMYITGHTSSKSFLIYVNEKDNQKGKRISYGNV